MPISKKRFEVIGAERVSPETNAEQITAFLLENDELAFRISEIAEQTGIKHGSTGPTLKRLEDDGVVTHRDKYWSISDNYAASREAMHHTATAAAEYDDGDSFDTAAWAAASADEDAQEFQDNT